MNSFKFLNAISFERIAGSNEELLAATMIKDKINSLDGVAEIEAFNIPFSTIKEAEIKVGDYKIEAKGFHLCANISETLEIVMVDNPEAVKFYNLENKAVLIPCRLTYSFYEEIVKAKAKAIIATSGSLYDDLNKTDLEENILRPRHLEHGKIACFTIRTIDAEKLAAELPTQGTFKLIQEEFECQSHNVIAKIEGTSKETIAITAHYDSVRFSKGVYDNGTGSITILDLYQYFKTHKPKYNLIFIWCGAEERGLLGSKAYTNIHKDDLHNIILNVNVDMTGVTLGYDIACVTGELAVVNYIDAFSKELGFPCKVSQGVYSSDSTPFADAGIPAISFARLSYASGAMIHSNKDNGKFLSEKTYIKTTNFIKDFLVKLNNSCVFPFEKKMPDNMQEEINKYYGRKSK